MTNLTDEPNENEDFLLGRAADCPPLIAGYDTVEAVCTRVKAEYFKPFRQHKFVFSFQVIAPQEYEGSLLPMFVRNDKEKWSKAVPVSAKLFIMAAIAIGQLPRRRKITALMFLKKAFRCRLKTVGKGTARYSIVEEIVERLTQTLTATQTSSCTSTKDS